MFVLWVMLCAANVWTRSSWHGSGARCPHEVPRYQARPTEDKTRHEMKNKTATLIRSHYSNWAHKLVKFDRRWAHLLLWVRIVCTARYNFDDGAPCRVTCMQTIVHWTPRPLCHGRMGSQHSSSIHWHRHTLKKGQTVRKKKAKKAIHDQRSECYLLEVYVIAGQMLRLVVVVSRVCNAGVVLFHELVLREGRLIRLQLRVHHVAAHQGLGPTRHGLCTTTQRLMSFLVHEIKRTSLQVVKWESYLRRYQLQKTKCPPVQLKPGSCLGGEVGWLYQSVWFSPTVRCR